MCVAYFNTCCVSLLGVCAQESRLLAADLDVTARIQDAEMAAQVRLAPRLGLAAAHKP